MNFFVTSWVSVCVGVDDIPIKKQGLIRWDDETIVNGIWAKELLLMGLKGKRKLGVEMNMFF